MISVNLKTIIKNIRAVRDKLRSGVLFCAVVKSNAYGMGAVEIATATEPCVDMFAVSNVREAKELRGAGIAKPILLLGVCQDIGAAVENNVMVTVTSIKEMQSVCACAGVAGVHIKVNTGLNRYGITTLWQLRSIIAIAKRYNVNVCGLYTHFTHETATADGQKGVERQIRAFAPFKALFRRNYPFGIVHAACSGQAGFTPAQYDMVRIGKSMYGGFAGYETAVEIAGKIVATQTVQKCQTVGYGGRFIARERTQIGVVNIGYAVAGFLLFCPAPSVFVGRVKCPVVGSVGMDSLMVDITGVKNPNAKRVTILGAMDGVQIMDYVNASGHSGARILTSLRLNLLSTRIKSSCKKTGEKL